MNEEKHAIIIVKGVGGKTCRGCPLQDDCRKELRSGHSISLFTKSNGCLVR